jgi:hypothetical protein
MIVLFTLNLFPDFCWTASASSRAADDESFRLNPTSSSMFFYLLKDNRISRLDFSRRLIDSGGNVKCPCSMSMLLF